MLLDAGTHEGVIDEAKQGARRGGGTDGGREEGKEARAGTVSQSVQCTQGRHSGRKGGKEQLTTAAVLLLCLLLLDTVEAAACIEDVHPPRISAPSLRHVKRAPT